jgi:WD40 repeat protein
MSRDALVVGLNTYQWLPSLGAPGRDAQAVADRLQLSGEFRVRRSPEVIVAGQPQVGGLLSMPELEAALVQLFLPSGPPPETALFYFSGHGLQKPFGLHEGYLATTESNPEAGFYGLSLLWLRQLLDRSPVRQRIVWLDCCHSGALLDLREADPGGRSGVDRCFVAASRSYEAAYESLDGRYSVLTEAILTGLDPDRSVSGVITNLDVTQTVSQALKGELQQPLFDNSGGEIVLTRALVRGGMEPARAFQPIAQGAGQSGYPVIAERMILRDGYRLVSDAAPFVDLLGGDGLSRGDSTGRGRSNAGESSSFGGRSSEPDWICPFPGLRYFDPTDAPFFTGREAMVQELILQLRQDNWLALVGAASSGKSSLLRAGLIPALRQGRLWPGSDRWEIRLIQPGDQPLLNLATAFVEPEAIGLDRADQLRRAMNLLEDGPTGLSTLVRTSVSRSRDRRAWSALEPEIQPRFLLVIDQFEDLLQLAGPAAEAERSRLIASLLQAAADLPQLMIVVSIRSDLWPGLQTYESLLARMERSQRPIEPLNAAQLRLAIERPAAQVGLRCDPPLVQQLVRDLEPCPARLALLQLVLSAIWLFQFKAGSLDRGLLQSTYTALGGLSGLLCNHATATYEVLEPEDQALAQRIFLALTQLGQGTQDSLRPLPKAELLGQSGGPALAKVLERLIQARLIVNSAIGPTPIGPSAIGQSGPDPLRQPALQEPIGAAPDWIEPLAQGPVNPRSIAVALTGQSCERIDLPLGPTLEAVHESLIRNWAPLQDWLSQRRGHIAIQRRIEAAASDWQHHGESRHWESLLQGPKLREAETYLKDYPQELTILARRYIALSRRGQRRTRRQRRLVHIALPLAVAMALGMTAYQLRSLGRTQQAQAQHEKIAQSQEQAALAQKILDDDRGDPMTALLLSRAAAELGAWTVEAQHSLRAALRSLQLRADIQSQGPITQMALSPDQQHLAAIDANGELQLWDVQKLPKQGSRGQRPRRLRWQKPNQSLLGRTWGLRTLQRWTSPKPQKIKAIAFSADSSQIAAIAENDAQVLIWNVQDGQVQTQLRDFTAPVDQIRYSPTRNLLATASGGSVDLWRIEAPAAKPSLISRSLIAPAIAEPLAHLGHRPIPGPVIDLQFDGSGRWLMIQGNPTDQAPLRLWDLEKDALTEPDLSALGTFDLSAAVISPRGDRLAIAQRDGRLHLWQPDQSLRPLATQLLPDNGPIVQMAFSPDGQSLVTRHGRQVWLWDLLTAKPKERLVEFATASQAAQASPGNSANLIQPANRSGQLGRSNPVPPSTNPSQNPAAANQLAIESPQLLRFSPDGQRLLVSGAQIERGNLRQDVRLFELSHGKAIATLRGNAEPIRDAQFAPRGDRFATMTNQGRIQIWQSEPGHELPTIDLPLDLLTQGFAGGSRTSTPMSWLALRPKVNQPLPQDLEFVAITRGGDLFRWNAMTGKLKGQPFSLLQLPELQGSPSTPLEAAAWSDVSNRLALVKDGQLWLWSLADRGQGRQLKGADRTSMVQFSRNGNWLIGIGGSQVSLWDVALGKLNLQINTLSPVREFQLSAQGRHLATLGEDGHIRLWDLLTGQGIGDLVPQNLSAWAISPDGGSLALASHDGHIVQMGAGAPNQPFKAIHPMVSTRNEPIRSVAFSQNGQTIAAASASGVAYLWDRKTGLELTTLESPDAQIDGVTFSRDSQFLATTTSRNQVEFWAATPESLLSLARERSLRSMSADDCRRYLRSRPKAFCDPS